MNHQCSWKIFLLNYNAKLEENINEIAIMHQPNWMNLCNQKYNNQSHRCSQHNLIIVFSFIFLFQYSLLIFLLINILINIKHHPKEQFIIPNTTYSSDQPTNGPTKHNLIQLLEPRFIFISLRNSRILTFQIYDSPKHEWWNYKIDNGQKHHEITQVHNVHHI